jgi:hypothetical protein
MVRLATKSHQNHFALWSDDFRAPIGALRALFAAFFLGLFVAIINLSRE